MKNRIVLLLLLSSLFSCTKDCTQIQNQCIDYAIIPKANVLNSGDLVSYLLKEDSTYFLNGDTFFSEAIKLVPKQGFIPWSANCVFINNENNVNILYFTNYGDTMNWRQLLPAAYQREQIYISNFKLELRNKQKVFDEKSYNNNSFLAKSIYAKRGGHGDLFDALWEIDLEKNSSIELTKIDSLNKFIEGRFELFFKLKSQSPGSPIKYAPQAHFTCGKFRAIIMD
ncbi:MAG TPA: hypothetical protein PKD32_12945 [Saprospiraceae bacterium]|nr:hypothetical protein [Saprospiraceae bacterium]